MFSVMISGPGFFPVDSNTDVGSVYSQRIHAVAVWRWEGGGKGEIMLVHSTLNKLTHKLLFLQIRNRGLLGTVFPHIIHLFSLLILFKSNYLVIKCMSEDVFPHLIFI